MTAGCLYFGREKKGKHATYAVAHVIDQSAGATRYSQGLSFDHLVGYLEGATAGRWTQVELKSELPEDVATRIDAEELSRATLTRILAKAQLSAHYPDL